MAECQFCGTKCNSWVNVNRHQAQTPAAESQSKKNKASVPKAAVTAAPTEAASNYDPSGGFDDGPSFTDAAPVPSREDNVDATQPQQQKDSSADSTGHPQWKEAFPGPAGATFGRKQTAFEIIRDEEILKGAEVLGPFKDDAEWQLAKWLIKHVGHTAADDFLKLSIIKERAQPSYTGKKSFFEKVDDLPGGAKWQCRKMDVEGDLPDLEKDPLGGTMREERLELWWQDPVECVWELIGNPAFRDVMRFAPERLYADTFGDVQVVNEMWTAEWWWEIQKHLPAGITIVPLILSSDKTMLSNFRGDNSAWPVYLTIGNIGKEMRRKVSEHATVLIGYLPVPKFDCFDKNTRALAKYRLFHKCMSIIMESVVEAGKAGVNMVCADNFVRNVWPILAAYVADYPEQCLIACCKENRCPLCTVPADKHGNHVPYDKRNQTETLFFMAHQQKGEKDMVFEADGIRAVYPPFWANLPHSDIFQAFTPDLLHQLHRGVFKDHLVKWCTEIIQKAEVDNRFRKMPDHPGLRHFKNGISSVSQWTGTEHKEMEKVFLGLVAADTDEEVVRAVRTLMDFASCASLQSHTSITLLCLRTALDEFHAHKQIFLDLHARKGDFNFPKLHSLDHYESLIRLFGSANGFNTESPERLHIDYAKNAYRASNRKDYIDQMTLWLQRQEAVARFSAFQEWMKTPSPLSPSPSPAASSSATPLQPPAPPTEDINPDSLPMTYHIAKRPPAATRKVVASHIIAATGHNAVRFLPALTTFLSKAGSSFIPHDFDIFGTWKRITFTLPAIPEVGDRHALNIVRATAPVTVFGTTAEAAHHDFALIRTGEVNVFTAGTALQGLCIAQVRAIFQLPSTYPVKSAQLLTYIEWFTPLRTPTSVDGYYHISRSTRKTRGEDGPYAEIITVDRIARNTMLIPHKWGQDVKFRVNSHIDGHTFCMFKLDLRDCLPV
ncbi:hypothetical protein B0H17DRAFT_1214266 [Mycena rosella]|uniref:Uncharacterized protein n=1 Tax=Mycena rosella TaxID=1033263 RepID=A0AAD7CNK1_MYCRO|nr:hypothetical protein B0H17DRAFT_1214266 [Mycena rosella]